MSWIIPLWRCLKNVVDLQSTTKIELMLPSLSAETRDLIRNTLYVMHLARSFAFPLPESEGQTFRTERKDSQTEIFKDSEDEGCNGKRTEMTDWYLVSRT